MIKRLVWTIILLSPALFAGIVAIFGGQEQASNLFNAGAAMNYTWESIINLIDLFKKEETIWTLIWHIILAVFFIMPFIFVWRGIFFIEWIPFVGSGLRAILIAALIFIPGVFQILSNKGDYGEFINEFGVYFQTVVLGLALIGLWLPKAITCKRRKD